MDSTNVTNPPVDDCYTASSLPTSNSINVTSGSANVTSPCNLKVFVSWIGLIFDDVRL